MQDDHRRERLVHEQCHAHQAQSIGRRLVPSEYDLAPWYQTEEGVSYAQIAGDWPYPYEFSTEQSLLEDFAEACQLWYTDAVRLVEISNVRYAWMRGNMP